ncbi:WXG100-like domain-containing protein [Mycolicibacterium psychrotolerans]|uniref:WXG100-like domain-containing protein n=1 Tax=Mycolicibacterium psychrotolerans TaxID=216929 RepID=UPI0013D7C2D0|nr:hypothetical protein [Mycolicibacterium psychrotolerans]
MRIEVDPDALIAAGRQTGALGGQLARLSDALGAALGGGISSGMDPAGLNFGMKYGHQAGAFTSAVADAANAFTSVGTLLEASGFNYRNADAASTIGGPGPAGGLGADPGKALPAHVPPGPNGVTVPPPSKWYMIQPLLQVVPGLGQVAGIAMTWPSGNAAMMGVTATQWRNFATGFALIEPQLTGIKAAVAAQQIPEGAAMTTALDSLGTAISSLADVSSSVAQSISDFASGVQGTQDAIRRLLDRLSLDGLWDTVTGFLTGEGDDILREVARDVGTVLHNFQQQVKGIVGLLDELTGLIGDAATAFQKWIRPILVEQFGDGAGNALANAVTLYTDVQVGAVTGLIGTVSGVVAMADPDTWKGMAEMALSVAKDPSTLPGVLENMGKEFVAWDKWSGDHPGRAAGEAAFNIGSLFVPGGALSKTGSVAKGLNLSRRVLEEGRLPGVRELGSWTRGTPNPIETPRVPEFTPAAPGGVPPVRPEGVPPVGPGQSTGAGGPSGTGPARTGEPPAAAGRPPGSGAEGGAGPRAPVEQAGRGGSGAEAAPRSGATAASPSPAPESGENSSAHPSGGHGSERTQDRIAHTHGESADRHDEIPPAAHDSPPLEVDSERASHIAHQLNEAYLHGSSTHDLARQLSDFSTHHVHDEGHLPGNVDRVVLGKWDGQDGGYIGEARANGGIYYDTGQEPWDSLTVGLSHEQVSDLGWQVNEEFLRTQMENGVSRIEYILDSQYASLEEVMIKRQGSFSAMEIEFLTENAPQYGYRRSGNTWVKG